MPDMLVKLYDIKSKPELDADLKSQGIFIKRVMALDKNRLLQFVKSEFQAGWANECDYAFSNHPISCFIAVKNKKVIGFACYDVTAKNFFGPVGVIKEYREQHIGTALTNHCLLSIKHDGYGYAIIGWAESAIPFYQKVFGAIVIENSFPGVYSQMISQE